MIFGGPGLSFCTKLAPSWPKLTPSWDKMAQVGPKLAQGGPSWCQVGPKLAQGGPSWSIFELNLSPCWGHVEAISNIFLAQKRHLISLTFRGGFLVPFQSPLDLQNERFV